MRTRSAVLSRKRAGFTLVELMIALALAAMVSVSIMFISSQARKAYDETVKKVDVYNRFRFALLQLENDIRGWISTSELEFFIDGRGRGARYNLHWDPGEELPDTMDEYGKGVVDGGTVGEYDEYAYILQRHYVSLEPMQTEQKRHDAYQMYFRTLMYIDGAVRQVNVEYALLDPNKLETNLPMLPPPPDTVVGRDVANLTLFKIVRYFDLNPDLIKTPNQTPIVRKVLEVCSNVTDFRVEYLVQRDVLGRVEPGFRTPEEEYRNPGELEARPLRDPSFGPTGGYKKLFGYGSVKLDVKYPLAQAIPGIRADEGLAGISDPRPVRFGFLNPKSIYFGELIPGDQIFIFTASERAEVQQGLGAQGAENAGKLMRFPSGDYTVQSNINGLLEFEEDLDTSEWGGKTQTGIYYKASYLPAAIRVTLRVVDDRGQNPKTLQREVWLRRRSR